jgi:hypothetical protein
MAVTTKSRPFRYGTVKSFAITISRTFEFIKAVRSESLGHLA